MGNPVNHERPAETCGQGYHITVLLTTRVCRRVWL